MIGWFGFRVRWFRTSWEARRVRRCRHYPRGDVYWESNGVRQATCGRCRTPIEQEVPK